MKQNSITSSISNLKLNMKPLLYPALFCYHYLSNKNIFIGEFDMVILSCSKVCKYFGIDVILEDINFSINEGQKLGIVGPNGAGKSTLFKLITGEFTTDGGEIFFSSNLSIGYLPQNASVDSNNTIWQELLKVYAPVLDMEKRLRELEHQMQDGHPAIMEEYANLYEKFEDAGGYSYESSIKGVLIGLGFNPGQYEQPIYQLSGGQKTRVALAKLLLLNPELLLLDEPTNHLDLDAMQWLEEYLKGYRGTVMLISHDRYFLDNICDSILEIENRKAQLYEGNYSEYKQKKDMLTNNQLKQYNLQQKEIKRQQAIIEKYRSFNREKSIRAAESRQKMLDKMELIEKPYKSQDTRISFDILKSTGNEVLIAKDLSMQFGQNILFKNLSFQLNKGDRVAILGPNGIGKTTLLKIVLGRLNPSSGSIKLGSNVTIGYYDQEQTSLNLENTVIQEVWEAAPNMTETEIRSALAAFLIRGDDVFKNISALSGGERGRVLLTKLALKKDNFLILDEPTNHLDLECKEVLEKALAEYPGTILVVSHDRYFLNKIIDRIIVMSNDGFEECPGNYEYYIGKKKEEALLESQKEQKKNETRTAQKQAQKQDREKRRKKALIKEQISELEKHIDELENKIADIEQILCQPELYDNPEKMLEINQEYSGLKSQLDDTYEKWLEISEG